MLDNVLATAQSLGIKVVRRWEGEEFDFGGAHAEVFYPARNAVIGDRARNNDSMVLRASYGDTSLLLEGDAEKTVERYVTARHQPTATLLKVGHHGSTNATTAELVSSARPAFAVISVGAGNSFGCRERKLSHGWAQPALACTAPIWMGQPPSIWTGSRSRFLFRLFSNLKLRGIVIGQRRALAR